MRAAAEGETFTGSLVAAAFAVLLPLKHAKRKDCLEKSNWCLVCVWGGVLVCTGDSPFYTVSPGFVKGQMLPHCVFKSVKVMLC